MSTIILVPVKEHEHAKSRMAAVLDPGERAMLARAMFEDVVRVLVSLPVPVAVVTNSSEAAGRATHLGWRLLWETRQISESASVDAASVQLAREGIASVLRLPADLPLVRPCDLEQVISGNPPPPFAVLVPSHDGAGTNAILRHPPDLFPSRFGQNSFILHLQEAKRSGAEVRVIENPNLALDLDDASDLRRFIEHPSDTLAYELLQKLGIEERLPQRDFS